MLDVEPPSPAAVVAAEQSSEAPQSASQLPSETRADGSLVIDLMPLAPPAEMCAEQEPDPFNPEIVVCRKTEQSPRLGAELPSADALTFGSAVPRARLKLSSDAEAQANITNSSVGGWNAQGAQAKVKLEF